MAIAVVLILVVVGSVLFHVMSPWWWTPIASNWSYIDHTITVTFWITGFVFAAVILFMAYCVLRFRHRPGLRAEYEPENKKLETWLTVLTAIGVAAMLAAYPAAFKAVQWIGAGYLAWLGLKMLRARPGDAPILNFRPRDYFRQTLFITLLNPKAIVFYMAFFPPTKVRDGPG